MFDPYKILKYPLITEKGTLLGQENKYLFRVDDGANKQQIRKAVETVYKVGVTGVHIVNTPEKKVRYQMRSEGYRSGIKKAIVTLKEGDKIAIT